MSSFFCMALSHGWLQITSVITTSVTCRWMFQLCSVNAAHDSLNCNWPQHINNCRVVDLILASRSHRICSQNVKVRVKGWLALYRMLIQYGFWFICLHYLHHLFATLNEHVIARTVVMWRKNSSMSYIVVLYVASVRQCECRTVWECSSATHCWYVIHVAASKQHDASSESEKVFVITHSKAGKICHFKLVVFWVTAGLVSKWKLPFWIRLQVSHWTHSNWKTSATLFQSLVLSQAKPKFLIGARSHVSVTDCTHYPVPPSQSAQKCLISV